MASVMVPGWIPRFAIPETITSYCAAFMSHLWTSLEQILGTAVHHTTADPPEANDIMERLHRTLKAAMVSQCMKSTWFSKLSLVLLGLSNTSDVDLDVSPAEMAYGDLLVAPDEFFHRLSSIVVKFIPWKPIYMTTDYRYVHGDLHSTKHVFLCTDAHAPILTPLCPDPKKSCKERRKHSYLVYRAAMAWSPSTDSSQHILETIIPLLYHSQRRPVPSYSQRDVFTEVEVL